MVDGLSYFLRRCWRSIAVTVEIVRELSLVDARQSCDASEGKDLAVEVVGQEQRLQALENK